MANEAPDVLVIGAGVIGLACAFHLVQAGKRVLLLDRDQPRLAASFGNAGHIATEQIFPLASPEVMRDIFRYVFDSESPLRIRPAYLRSILPWLLRFAWSSRQGAFDRGVTALSSLQYTAMADMANLLREAKALHLLKTAGHLVLVENAASVSGAQKEIVRLGAFGIHADWLSPSQVGELAPDITAPIKGAMQFTGSGHVNDPHLVCEALCDAFLAAGGQFAAAEIIAVESIAAGFTAHTSTGARFRGKQLVLCGGAWSKPLAAQLGYPVPLDTERGYHIELPGIFPRFNIPVASLERKIIMMPLSGGLRMTGTVEFGGMQLAPDPKRYAMLKRHMNALVANIPTDNMTTWMGFRPSLPDHLPVLGRAPDGRNLFFAFGHQHLGLTLAGVTARIIAAQVVGRELDISLVPFAPDRF